jgi:hypothetical protein
VECRAWLTRKEPVDRVAVDELAHVLLDARVRLSVDENRPEARERELVVEAVEEFRVEGVRDVSTTVPTAPVLRVIRLRAARFGV